MKRLFFSRKKKENRPLFLPYNQQLKKGRAYYGMVFLCEPESGELKESLSETRNPKWIKISEVRKITEKKPEKLFPLNVPVLKYYLSLMED